MSEPVKIEPAALATESAPVAEAPTAEAVATAPAAAPAKKPDARGGGDKKRKSQGGGGTPRARTREAIPSLVDYARFDNIANVRELDAEIESELEAALNGVNQTELFAVDSSKQVQAAIGTGQTKKIGKVLAIRGPDIFVHVPGGRSEGVISKDQFPEGIPVVGADIEISIEGYDQVNGLLILARKWGAVQADWSTITEGMIVEARVLETNKGGLSVDVNGIKGFMPISQIDLFRVEKADQYVSQKLTCIVTEANPSERNLIVSRRALLEKQREEMREKTWATLEVGQIREGIVRNVKAFGAFVDMDGVDGFLHISEMSWKRVLDATQVLQPGQIVKVAVLKVDREARKVSIGLKQLEASPWDGIHDKYAIGTIVNGKVTRTADFGAFVELEPGLEGLIHVSELAGRRTWRVEDVVKVDQEVAVKVLSVDIEARRISLSLKQAMVREAPKSEDDEDDGEPETPVKERPRPTNLRGGLGAPTLLLGPPTE